MSHTPGPWNIDVKMDEANTYRLWDSEDNYPEDTSLPTRNANARLMSAAPDLLEQLKVAFLYLRHVDGDNATTKKQLEKWEALIAKAEGK